MANTFKVITRDVAPASSGTPETYILCSQVAQLLF